jgi:hypothetical protein
VKNEPLRKKNVAESKATRRTKSRRRKSTEICFIFVGKKLPIKNGFNTQPSAVGAYRLLRHGLALCSAEHGVGANV